jgi:hypothetical protein
MARKNRDYKAEYRARTERAQAKGFKSYGRQRRTREAIQTEFKRLKKAGLPSPDINPRTKAGQAKMRLFEKARLEIIKKNLSGEVGAAKRVSEKLKKEIRALFTDPDTGELDGSYYAAMRALYPKGTKG